MNRIIELAEKYKDEMLEDRRYFHQNPELSNQEKNTAAYVKAKLEKLGVEVTEGYAGHGLQGMIWGEDRNARTIMLRADMDALAVVEDTDLPYKSANNGVMHACGHDVHTAGLLGAARILTELKGDLNGNVKLCFQPAEEGDGGARLMIEDGIMQNPKVDYSVGLHMDPLQKVGQAAVEPGPISSYPNFFEYTIIGRGGHGAFPHASIDPIRPASVLYQMLQGLRSEITSLEPAVVQVCRFDAGTSWSAIPDKAIIGGTTRTLSAESQAHVKARLTQFAKEIESLYPVKCEFVLAGVSKPVINTPKYVEPVKKCLSGIFSEYTIDTNFKMGGEDFSFFSDYGPATFILVGSASDDPSTKYPLHNPKFTVDEDVLPKAAAALATVAVNYLSTESF